MKEGTRVWRKSNLEENQFDSLQDVLSETENKQNICLRKNIGDMRVREKFSN